MCSCSTTHAAVCVHGIEDKGYSAILGVSELHVKSDEARLVSSDGKMTQVLHTGDMLSIHGQTGEVLVGTRDVMIIKKGKQAADVS